MPEYQIVGPPGTGKTTTLARQIQRAAETYDSTRVVVASLTKAAAAEIVGRDIPIPKDHAGTLHSLALRTLNHPKVADGLVPDFNKDHPQYAVTPQSRTPDGDSADGRGGDQPGDEAREMIGLLRARMVDPSLWPRIVMPWWNAWEAFKTDTGSIDFTDMIELALSDVGEAPGSPDAIFVDEVQDLSRLEMALVRKWGESARSLVLAGDADQAIYEWRGADPAIFVAHDVGDRRRVLAQSYRVPRAVHAAASKWIRQIKARIDAEYLPRDADGSVAEEPSARWKYPEPLLPQIEAWLKRGDTAMVAAACDYMLSPTIAVLRREGIPFANPWRRANGAWNPLGRRRDAVAMVDRLLSYLRPDVNTYGDAAHGWGAEDLRRWTEVLKAEGILRRGAKSEIVALGAPNEVDVDIADLWRWFEEDALDTALNLDVDWWKRSLLAAKQGPATFPVDVFKRRGADALRDTPRLYVGTVHSYKGSEADHVVLFPDLSPAGMRQWQGSQPERDSVVRQFYVAMTRARESLTICSASSPYAVTGLTG